MGRYAGDAPHRLIGRQLRTSTIALIGPSDLARYTFKDGG
jgi:hypothetical protein